MSLRKDTKLKSDIAEHSVIAQLLRKNFRVLKPIGDRLPYDLAIDTGKRLVRIQIKSAWRQKGLYVVDSRRTKTNRRLMLRSRYNSEDFDFAIFHIQEINVFYVMPFDVFNSYKSGIGLVEAEKRQRKPRSFQYREAWHLLEESNPRSFFLAQNSC